MKYATHKDYFATLPTAVRKELRAIAAAVEKQIPAAVPCISYSMPAYKGRKVFFYFAAFKKHIGIYPPVKADLLLIEACKAFRGPKGNLSFPLNQPIPIGLIRRVAQALYLEYGC